MCQLLEVHFLCKYYFSQIIRKRTAINFLAVNSKNPDQVAKRYKLYQEARALDVVEKNVVTSTKHQLNEFDQKEFQILHKYWDEGHFDPDV